VPGARKTTRGAPEARAVSMMVSRTAMRTSL
jgi:hypothetical protein